LKMGNPFDQTGKTALVTGCRRGIGRAIAESLAEAGADIIGISTSLQADGDEVGKAVRKSGRHFTSYQCDLGERTALRRFLADLEEHGHTIDILIDNAGMIRRAPVEEQSDEDWGSVIEVNLSASFVLARELGRKMIERGGGKIIFVASVLSFQGGVNVSGYAASECAVANLTRALANEWANKNVNVNAVAPGYVETDVTADLRNDPERNSELLARVPAERWGTPKDITGPVLFLASEVADFVHGAVLPVDGGWLGR
jgi:2-deoxy-D-gluconate 3-dehydrogenase